MKSPPKVTKHKTFFYDLYEYIFFVPFPQKQTDKNTLNITVEFKYYGWCMEPVNWQKSSQKILNKFINNVVSAILFIEACKILSYSLHLHSYIGILYLF